MLELVRTTTADGLHLDGAFRQPAALKTDVALVLIHGTGGNFYSGGILQVIGDQAVDNGFPVLRINTRGHDLAASIPGSHGPVPGGAAYEHVLDCRHDVSAWCDFLCERGQRKIVLVGHSLGGVKAIWSQALAPHPAVCGVVGISPPRFCHQRFQADSRCEPFRDDYARAQELVSEGRPESLLTITQPLPMMITAAGFLEKYGPEDRLDYVPVLPKIKQPKLILLGGQTVETNPAFAELPRALEHVGANDLTLRWELIPSADMNYRNAPTEPWRLIREWLIAEL